MQLRHSHSQNWIKFSLVERFKAETENLYVYSIVFSTVYIFSDHFWSYILFGSSIFQVPDTGTSHNGQYWNIFDVPVLYNSGLFTWSTTA